jgi:hypothetical protein
MILRLGLALLASLWLGVVPPTAAETEPGCKASSWNPEVHSFYGTRDKILERVAALPVKLGDRRVFLQVTEGESGSHVKLYEQQKDNTFTVTEWATKDASQLLGEIDRVIITNKGVNCVGEQVKGLLIKTLKEGKVSTAVPSPESTTAAFGHDIKGIEGAFVRSTIAILC